MNANSDLTFKNSLSFDGCSSFQCPFSVVTKRLRMCGARKVFCVLVTLICMLMHPCWHWYIFCRNTQVTNSHHNLSNSLTLNLGIISLKTPSENSFFEIQTSLKCIVFGHGILLQSFSSFREKKLSNLWFDTTYFFSAIIIPWLNPGRHRSTRWKSNLGYLWVQHSLSMYWRLYKIST